MGLIYVDSCVLIYHVENHPTFATSVAQALGVLNADRFAISPLVKFECLVGALKENNLPLVQQYRTFFDRFVSLEITESVYLDAAELRARFRLKTPDAIHLACAQYHRCDTLLTNDDRLAKASFGMARSLDSMLPK